MNIVVKFKIMSGGQTGVDRAALDVALDQNISCGGWCPKGRKTEDGTLSKIYPLQETPSDHYSERTKWNVRDSDGTMILTWGPPKNGTKLTINIAKKLNKPYIIVDMISPPTISEILDWMATHQIQVLNIAGPRGSFAPFVYSEARVFIEILVKNILTVQPHSSGSV